MSTDKLAAYRSLVKKRKACHACAGLTNPSDCAGGSYDSEHVGPWSLWQGKLDAELMVVGQDWGDEEYFVTNRGHDAAHNKTNETLRALLRSLRKISSGERSKLAMPRTVRFPDQFK